MAGSIVRCTYDFKAEADTDLTFSIGDLIKITKIINEDWYEGALNGKTGQFPKAFVEECHDVFDVGIATNTFNAEQEGDLSLKEGELVVVTEVVDENWMRGYVQGGKHGMFPRIFIKPVSFDSTNIQPPDTTINEGDKLLVEALYDFTAHGSNELELKVGDVIEVLDDSDEFWCEGKTKDGRQGTFPRDFVNLPAKDKKTEESDSAKKESTSAQVELTSTQVESQSETDIIENEIYIGTALAEYDYSSSVEGDLSFKIGDEILLLENIDGAWCRGRLGDNIGIFPTGYVVITDKPSSIKTELPKSDADVSTVTPADVNKPVKKKPPGRPKLPTTKDFVPFCYQFNTKSQPTVIIPPSKLKPGQQNILLLKKRTEIVPASNKLQPMTSVNDKRSLSPSTSYESSHHTSNVNNESTYTSYESSTRKSFESNAQSYAGNFDKDKLDSYGSSAIGSNAQSYAGNFDKSKLDSYGSSATKGFGSNAQSYAGNFDKDKLDSYGSATKGFGSNAQSYAGNFDKSKLDSYGSSETKGFGSNAQNYGEHFDKDKFNSYGSSAKKGLETNTQGFSDKFSKDKFKGYESTAKKEFDNVNKNIPNDNMSTYQKMKCANNNLNTAVTVANAVGIKTTKTEIAKGAVKMGAGAYVVGSQPSKDGKQPPPMKMAAVKGLGSKFGSKK